MGHSKDENSKQTCIKIVTKTLKGDSCTPTSTTVELVGSSGQNGDEKQNIVARKIVKMTKQPVKKKPPLSPGKEGDQDASWLFCWLSSSLGPHTMSWCSLTPFVHPASPTQCGQLVIGSVTSIALSTLPAMHFVMPPSRRPLNTFSCVIIRT